jgi:hypothetical protein
MALNQCAKKSEHGGPKRGQDAWCRKYEAKQAARKHRRAYSARLEREAKSDSAQ